MATATDGSWPAADGHAADVSWCSSQFSRSALQRTTVVR